MRTIHKLEMYTCLALALLALIYFGQGRIGVDRRDEHGMSALMRAARAGDLAEAERLIAGGADVNAKVPTRDLQEFVAFISWMQQLPASDIGYTPLMYAVQGGHPDLATLLLRSGARVDETDRHGKTALMLAVFNNDLPMIGLLADAGATVAPEHLAMAIGRGSPALVRLLLERGGNPNGMVGDEGPAPAPPPLLIGAVRRGDAGIVRVLLDAGANPEATDENGWTALRWARHAGSEEVAELLLARGAADTQAADEGLLRAARDGDADAVKAALAQGGKARGLDERGVPVLLHAASSGSADSVQALIDAGADVNATSQYDGTALLAAASGGHVAVIERLIAAGANVRHRDPVSETALYESIQRQRRDATAALLRGGADPNDGSLALAALRGDLETLRLLLEHGADPRLPQGLHALTEAARGSEDAAILLLLERGADPRNPGQDKTTPLHRAASNCGPAAVQALLDRGADPNQKELNGWTPLHHAAGAGRLDNVRVLIAARADVNARDDEGKSILAHAARYPEVQEALRQAGAR